jgi:hypothetical protein
MSRSGQQPWFLFELPGPLASRIVDVAIVSSRTV